MKELQTVLFQDDAAKLRRLRRLLVLAESMCAQTPTLLVDGGVRTARGRHVLVSSGPRTMEITGDDSVHISMPGPSFLQEGAEKANPALRLFRQAADLALYRSLLTRGRIEDLYPPLLRDVVTAVVAMHGGIPDGTPMTIGFPRLSVPASVAIHLAPDGTYDGEPAATMILRHPKQGAVADLVASLPNALDIRLSESSVSMEILIEPLVAYPDGPASPTEHLQAVRRGSAVAEGCFFETEIVF